MFKKGIRLLLQLIGANPKLKVEKVSDTNINDIKQVDMNGYRYLVFHDSEKNVQKVEHFGGEWNKCPFCLNTTEICPPLTKRSEEISVIIS